MSKPTREKKGAPSDRKHPFRHWLSASATTVGIFGIIAILAMLAGYDIKFPGGMELNKPGKKTEISKGASFNQEEKRLLLNAARNALNDNEKKVLIKYLEMGTEFLEYLKSKDMTVNDIVTHPEDDNLHIFNQKTYKIHPEIEQLKKKVAKVEKAE